LRQLIRDLQQAALADTRLADGNHAAALIQDVAHQPHRVIAAEQTVSSRRYVVHQVIIRHGTRPIEGRLAPDRGFSPLR
jgi:hypothetical protein